MYFQLYLEEMNSFFNKKILDLVKRNHRPADGNKAVST